MKKVLPVLCAIVVMTSCGRNESKSTSSSRPPEAPGTKHSAVDARRVHGIGYDETDRVLTVHSFWDQRCVEYRDVPKDVYEKLIQSKSKGEYTRENVSGKYSETVVTNTSRWMTIYDDK